MGAIFELLDCWVWAGDVRAWSCMLWLCSIYQAGSGGGPALHIMHSLGGGLWDEVSREWPQQMLWLMFAGIGKRAGQLDGRNKRMKKMNHDVHHGSFSVCTGLASHTLGLPPGAFLSPIPPSSGLEPPTSLWKGEGQVQQVRISKQNEVLKFEPTSLKRGEGLFSGKLSVVGRELRL